MKQRNDEVKILYDNIMRHSTVKLAQQIAYGLDLSLSSTVNERKEWVEYISLELEKYFDEQTIKDIRMGCSCNENGKLDESKKFIKEVYNSSASMEDFVGKMNDCGAGWYMNEGHLYTKYFSCPCPMLEGINILATKTWCYCTVGYNKKIFEHVFECEVDVELLESIKMGDDHCLMKIVPNYKKY